MVTKQLEEILSLEMKNSCTDFAKTVDTYCNNRYSCTSIVQKPKGNTLVYPDPKPRRNPSKQSEKGECDISLL